MTYYSRREFLRDAALTSGALALSQSVLRAEAADRARPPNIVMIISDDQGWNDYGFMDHPVIQTPNLDRLASQSVVFTRGYITAPLCCPSLASIITGLHPHQNKITSNDPPKVPGKKRWPPERLAMREKVISHIEKAPTLPRMLKERGYLSFQTGKWWMGNHSRGGFTGGMTHGDPKRGGRHGDAGLAIGRKTMQPIYDFIDKAGDNPFFLWYAPFMPHLPHNPADRLLTKYKDKTESIYVARYWAMCEWFDETCGQLLDYLNKRGLSDNTMVLYVCDNGWIQLPSSPRHTPRSKTSWYDGGVRTPIMVRWPGHVKPRRDEETPVSSIDLAPTILAASGLSPTREMQGLNLLDEKAARAREAIFGASYSHDARDINDPSQNLWSRWVVKGWWKLILPEQNQPRGKVPELYDLKADPYEKTNLAARHPGRVQELRGLIDRWYNPKG